MLASASQEQVVQARLGFATGPQTLPVNQCSGVTTVRVENGDGVPWNVPAATVVNLSSSSPAGPLFADSSCTTAISTLGLAAGTSSASFHWLDTRAGTPVLSATAASLAPASQSQTIIAGPPAVWQFVTAAQLVGAGLCSGLATVEQADSFGNSATQATAISVGLLSSSSGASFYADSTCGVPAVDGGLTIDAGTSAASFYWKDTAVGSPLLTVSSSPLTDATQAQLVLLGPATRLAFPAAAQTLAAGQCSAAITVQSQNAGGTPENVTSLTPVTLSSSSSGGSFFSDPACATTPAFELAIPSGGNASTVYWRDTRVGEPLLSATAIGFSPAAQSQTVTPDIPVKIFFTTRDQTITAGACSEETGFTTGDALDNPSPGAQAVSAVLTSSSQGTGFFSDPGCRQSIGTVTVAAGTSSAVFYWRDAFTGTPAITATTSTLGKDSQTHTVGGRDQVRFRWYSSSGVPLAGENFGPQLAPGTLVHLRIAVRPLGYNWKLEAADFTAVRENLANEEVVTGSYLNLESTDGVTEILTESKTGQGQGWRTLGNPAEGGDPDHSFFLGSAIPQGQATYVFCLVARTTAEALRIGWTATATPSATPRYPPGWQLTSTTLTETCFDLKPDGFNGGPLTIYLQDALRAQGTDTITDSFTLDRLWVKGLPGTYIGLERIPHRRLPGAASGLDRRALGRSRQRQR